MLRMAEKKRKLFPTCLDFIVPYQRLVSLAQGKRTFEQEQKNEDCSLGGNCGHGFKCPNKHSTQEQELFFLRDKNRNYFARTVWCNSVIDPRIPCRMGRACFFVHKQEQCFCLSCFQFGHLLHECMDDPEPLDVESLIFNATQDEGGYAPF
jgi:hypothetical protein